MNRFYKSVVFRRTAIASFCREKIISRMHFQAVALTAPKEPRETGGPLPAASGRESRRSRMSFHPSD